MSRSRRWHTVRFLVLLIFITSIIYFQYFFNYYNASSSNSQKFKLSPFYTLPGKCYLPTSINPFSKEMTDIVETKPKLNCHRILRFTYLDKLSSEVYINSTVAGLVCEQVETLNCKVYSLKRYSDDKTKRELIGQIRLDKMKLTVDAGLKFISTVCGCKARNVKNEINFEIMKSTMDGTNMMFYDLHSRVVPKTQKSDSPGKKHRFNVVMLGIDSISRAHTQRSLPKTYKLLQDQSTVFKKYNVIGKNTQPNLYPLLTGKFMSDLPEFFTNHNTATKISGEDLPIIWKDFKSKGYSTVFYEDFAKYGVFNFLANGFENEPVDYYSRNVFTSDVLKKMEYSPVDSDLPNLCFGSTSKHEFMLDFWLKQMLNKLPIQDQSPVFEILYTSEYSHGDFNLISVLDDDLSNTLSEVFNREDTIFIVFSDHGYRVGGIFEETVQGKIEHMLPLMTWKFPKRFEQMYGKKLSEFRKNAEHHLVSPFDIYETLRDLTDLEEYNFEPKSEYGKSLFRGVYMSRTCEDIGIPPSLCACYNWKPLFAKEKYKSVLKDVFSTGDHTLEKNDPKLSDNMAELGSICADAVNKRVLDKRANHYCSKWKFSHVDLSFFTKTDSDSEIVRLSVQLSPSSANARYDCTLQKLKNSTDFELIDIIRTSKYGHQPDCLPDVSLGALREYCCCKDRPECKN